MGIDGGGRVVPTRAFVRLRAGGRVVDGPLAGVVGVGPLRLDLACEASESRMVWRGSFVSTAAEPVSVDSIGFGFVWTGVDTANLRHFRQGFQSWSFAGSAALDDAGTPPFPSGSWLRGFHHVLDEVAADRSGWHESDGLSAVGAPSASATVVAGVMETGAAFGVVYLRRQDDGVAIEVEQRFERVVAPGESVALEAVRVEVGIDASELLARFAEEQGRAAGARVGAPFQSGWCSWYYYFFDIDEERFLRNLDALAAAGDELPLDVVQLDSGYQRACGDWLETSDRFPRGLPFVAERIRDAGFTPGIWTAPFCVVPESRGFADHPAWLLRRDDGPLRCLYEPSWTPDGWVYALDPTHPEVAAHLEHVFSTTVGWGFTHQKLDFLYAAALRSDAHDPTLTRAQRLRRGLDAVRRGAGEHAFLLGCGCPLGPAVGVVDGMRIGPDTAPWWGTTGEAGIAGVEPTLPGLEPTVPSAHNALRNTMSRAWMHRRLWLNDPDCVMVRDRRTRLTPTETVTMARSIAATGGMTVLSDAVTILDPDRRAMLRATVALAREVDTAIAAGGVPQVPLLESTTPTRLTVPTADGRIELLVNDLDKPRATPGSRDVEEPVEVLLGPAALVPDAPDVLDAHGSVLYRLGGTSPD